jgi:hypothetical protein
MPKRAPQAAVAVLVLLLSPAFAASQRDHDDCNQDGDPDRSIRGCTAIAQDAGETQRNRTIAFISRGLAW